MCTYVLEWGTGELRETTIHPDILMAACDRRDHHSTLFGPYEMDRSCHSYLARKRVDACELFARLYHGCGNHAWMASGGSGYPYSFGTIDNPSPSLEAGAGLLPLEESIMLSIVG